MSAGDVPPARPARPGAFGPQTSGPQTSGPETFGPYLLEERIGHGGMGEVYRAFDTARERTVAVKRLHAGLGDDEEYRERFRRESRTVARLSSPHVIPIHDFGTIDDRLYIDMRLVAGDDLAAVIARNGRLDPARAVEIVRQTADALDTAHEDGLVHRDVKPSNVLVADQRSRDFVYLVDFGIARAVGGAADGPALTRRGVAFGTLAYMAPEVFRSRDLDHRVDVYALGALLFEAVAGRPPFLSAGPALMDEHLRADPPALAALVPGVPPALDAVVATAMAKDPARRFATAEALADAAVAAIGGPGTGSVAAPPAPVPFHAPSPFVAEPVPPPPVPPPPVPPPPVPPAPVPPPPYAYRPGPVPARPSRGRGTVIALVAGLAVLLAVLGVGAAVLVERTPASTAPVAAPVAGPRPLAQVFPGANATSCRSPQAGESLSTSTGVDPAEALICLDTDVAPAAEVIYARWPDPAGARDWYRDTEAIGPRADPDATWTAGGAVAGPLVTAEDVGTVYTTGIYEGLAYSWEIRTATLDQARQVREQLEFRPRAEVGG